MESCRDDLSADALPHPIRNFKRESQVTVATEKVSYSDGLHIKWHRSPLTETTFVLLLTGVDTCVSIWHRQHTLSLSLSLGGLDATALRLEAITLRLEAIATLSLSLASIKAPVAAQPKFGFWSEVCRLQRQHDILVKRQSAKCKVL